MLRARSERQPELGDDAREAFAEPEPTSSPGGVSFGFVSHRGFGDVTPSASDLVHGDVDAIPAELRPIITQGEPMRIAQLIVAHPQLQAPIYTAMQRQHGYAAVQSVAKLAIQSQAHQQVHDASDLSHMKDGPLGPMAVVPDNYVGPQPPNAVRESDYQRMVQIYQRIESGESSVSFDLSNFFTNEDGSVLSPTDPLAYAKAGLDAAKFRQQYLSYIRELVKTPAGLQLLTRLDSSKHKTSIRHSVDGNAAKPEGTGGYRNEDGSLGSGTDVTIFAAPDRTEWDGEMCQQGYQPWMKDRPKFGFYHELVHAYHFNRGDNEINGNSHAQCVTEYAHQIGNWEFQAVGLGPYESNAVSENAIRAQMGAPLRTTYSGARWNGPDRWVQQEDAEEPPRRSPAR